MLPNNASSVTTPGSTPPPNNNLTGSVIAIGIILFLSIIAFSLLFVYLCWKIRRLQKRIDDGIEATGSYQTQPVPGKFWRCIHPLLQCCKRATTNKADCTANRVDNVSTTDIQRHNAQIEIEDEISDSIISQEDLKEKLRRFSVALGYGRRVDVFNPSLREDSVIYIAQRYMRETITEEVIAEKQVDQTTSFDKQTVKVEDITVISNVTAKKEDKHDKGKINGSFEDSDKSNYNRLRPKSYMLQQNVGNENKDINPGMFVHEQIGSEGGSLSVTNVHLIIPEGSLVTDVRISLGLLWDRSFFPPLEPGEALISPVVVCQPNGLKFNRCVRLLLPHCAYNIENDWQIKVRKSEMPIQDGAKWENISLEDYEERIIKTRTVQLSLKHFTLYAITAVPKSNVCAKKWVHLVPFAPPITRDKFFKIRVYCTDDYRDEDTAALKSKCKLIKPTLHQADDFKPIEFHSDGNDMVVRMINTIPDTWDLKNAPEQKIDFQAIWSSQMPSCTFIFKPKTKTASEILSTMLGFQSSHQQQSQEMIIAETEQSSDPNDIGCTFSVFLPTLRQQLVMLLDPQNVVSKDWRHVAEHLGFTWPEIRYLSEQKGTECGPTEQVLRKWENVGKSLSEFADLMRQFERMDVVSAIEDICGTA